MYMHVSHVTCTCVTTRAGLCQGTISGGLPVGNVTALLNVGMCNGFNQTYNAFTGFGTSVAMFVEEYPKRM